MKIELNLSFKSIFGYIFKKFSPKILATILMALIIAFIYLCVKYPIICASLETLFFGYLLWFLIYMIIKANLPKK